MIGFGRTLKNIGGRATSPGISKAVRVSTGADRPQTFVKHGGGGSSAGLNAHKTARLEMNGTGYGNTNLYKARRTTKQYSNNRSETVGPPAHYGRRTLHTKNDFRTHKFPTG